jgi:uncharacterized protein (TIGR02246 family)
MKGSWLVVAILLTIPAALLSQEAQTSNAEQEVKDAINQYRQALLKADTEALDRIWSDDYTFVNARGELLTKQQRLANFKSGATKIDSIEGDEETSVRVFGDVAVGLSNVYLTAQYGGKEGTGRVRSMHVWMRRDGRWQLVAAQLTPVTQP